MTKRNKTTTHNQMKQTKTNKINYEQHKLNIIKYNIIK